jgi:hypothetical protein
MGIVKCRDTHLVIIARCSLERFYKGSLIIRKRYADRNRLLLVYTSMFMPICRIVPCVNIVVS